MHAVALDWDPCDIYDGYREEWLADPDYRTKDPVLLTREELEGLREVEAANLADEVEECLHIYYDPV